MHCPTQQSRRRFLMSLASATALSACAGGSATVSQSRPDVVARSVAVLLPLSGPRANVGQTMAKSVWLAEDLGLARGRARIIDSGETAASAGAAAEQAIAVGADVIVGPLFSTQTDAVRAAAGDTPVLTLSNDDSLAARGAWVFGISPAQSIDAMLRFAKSEGAGRIAVLETGGPIGTRTTAALAAASKKSGAALLPVVSATTRPADVRSALMQSGNGSLPDILYVPAATPASLDQAVASVAAGVTTIGSMQWSSLPQDRFAQLDKACFIGPDPVRFGRMSSSFRAQLDEEMGVIGALAVDAVSFAQSVGGQGNLSKIAAVEGLLGLTSFKADRTCARTLSVMRIEGTGVVKVA